MEGKNISGSHVFFGFLNGFWHGFYHLVTTSGTVFTTKVKKYGLNMEFLSFQHRHGTMIAGLVSRKNTGGQLQFQ